MIDLESLAVSLGVPEDTATPLVHRAAVALERRHRPGVHLTGTVRNAGIDEELRWRLRTPGAGAYEDINRVTEEGAEAIGLALACSTCAWRVERRLQARLAEGTDWLMTNASTGGDDGSRDRRDGRAGRRGAPRPQDRAGPTFALFGARHAGCVRDTFLGAEREDAG